MRSQASHCAQEWTLLANARTQAREYGRSAALRRAAELTHTGALHPCLGRLDVAQEEWPKAGTAVLTALARRDLGDEGDACVLQGITCCELNLKAEAREAFDAAEDYAPARVVARRWLAYTASEEPA